MDIRRRAAITAKTRGGGRPNARDRESLTEAQCGITANGLQVVRRRDDAPTVCSPQKRLGASSDS